MSQTHDRYRFLSREEDNRDKNQKQFEEWKDDRLDCLFGKRMTVRRPDDQ